MKAKKILKIIKNYPLLKAEQDFNERVTIKLPDGGKVAIGIDEKTKMCNFNFLFFNISGSPIRLKESSPISGKTNYFGSYPVEKLNDFLKELTDKIQP